MQTSLNTKNFIYKTTYTMFPQNTKLPNTCFILPLESQKFWAAFVRGEPKQISFSQNMTVKWPIPVATDCVVLCLL